GKRHRDWRRDHHARRRPKHEFCRIVNDVRATRQQPVSAPLVWAVRVVPEQPDRFRLSPEWVHGRAIIFVSWAAFDYKCGKGRPQQAAKGGYFYHVRPEPRQRACGTIFGNADHDEPDEQGDTQMMKHLAI